jgi:hypothetical protein
LVVDQWWWGWWWLIDVRVGILVGVILFLEAQEILVHPYQLLLCLHYFLADHIDPGLSLNGLDVVSLFVDLLLHLVKGRKALLLLSAGIFNFDIVTTR